MVLPLDAATHSSRKHFRALWQQKVGLPTPTRWVVNPVPCMSITFVQEKIFFSFLGKGLNKDTTLAAGGVWGVLSPPPLVEQLHPLLQSLIRNPNPF